MSKKTKLKRKKNHKALLAKHAPVLVPPKYTGPYQPLRIKIAKDKA